MGTLVDDLEDVVRESRRLGLPPPVTRIKLKEKLQLYALDFVYNSSNHNHLIFYGGTCLRICFDLNRMSEDVDFETAAAFDKEGFAENIRNYFAKSVQYDRIGVHLPGRGIDRIELRFPVLRELGLSAHESENLMVKVEVHRTDAVYPTEFKTFSADRFGFVIRHYDLPTLMAGKMAACLERVWEKRGVRVKGRDYYDLLWYMQKGVIPNGDRLAAAKGKYALRDAFEEIRRKIEKIRPGDLLTDLEALFENREFPEKWALTFKEQFRRLYDTYVEKL